MLLKSSPSLDTVTHDKQRGKQQKTSFLMLQSYAKAPLEELNDEELHGIIAEGPGSKKKNKQSAFWVVSCRFRVVNRKNHHWISALLLWVWCSFCVQNSMIIVSLRAYIQQLGEQLSHQSQVTLDWNRLAACYRFWISDVIHNCMYQCFYRNAWKCCTGTNCFTQNASLKVIWTLESLRMIDVTWTVAFWGKESQLDTGLTTLE